MLNIETNIQETVCVKKKCVSANECAHTFFLLRYPFPVSNLTLKLFF